jgi:nitrite reductase/ring-hydroxylating ferredoxin subunit
MALNTFEAASIARGKPTPPTAEIDPLVNLLPMGRQQKWVRASSTDQVPADGKGHAFRIDGLDIAIFNWDQAYYAVENFCPHLGFPLSEGLVHDGSVICGWHGWRVRLEDGGCGGGASTATCYPCETRGDSIWVQVPEKAGDGD